jgi:hypothetical protein
MTGPTQARSPSPSRPIGVGLPLPRARPWLRWSPAPARLGFRAKHGKLRAYKAAPPRASHACRLPRLHAPDAAALLARSPPPWPPPGRRRFIARAQPEEKLTPPRVFSRQAAHPPPLFEAATSPEHRHRLEPPPELLLPVVGRPPPVLSTSEFPFVFPVVHSPFFPLTPAPGSLGRRRRPPPPAPPPSCTPMARGRRWGVAILHLGPCSF